MFWREGGTEVGIGEHEVPIRNRCHGATRLAEKLLHEQQRLPISLPRPRPLREVMAELREVFWNSEWTKIFGVENLKLAQLTGVKSLVRRFAQSQPVPELRPDRGEAAPELLMSGTEHLKQQEVSAAAEGSGLKLDGLPRPVSQRKLTCQLHKENRLNRLKAPSRKRPELSKPLFLDLTVGELLLPRHGPQ